MPPPWPLGSARFKLCRARSVGVEGADALSARPFLGDRVRRMSWDLVELIGGAPSQRTYGLRRRDHRVHSVEAEQNRGARSILPLRTGSDRGDRDG